MTTHIIQGRARWRWRPLFQSQIKSDSPIIAYTMAQAEAGDTILFQGNFFITEPFTIKGKAIKVSGGCYYFLNPITSCIHVTSEVPDGLLIENIHVMPLPSHKQWFLNGIKRMKGKLWY